MRVYQISKLLLLITLPMLQNCDSSDEKSNKSGAESGPIVSQDSVAEAGSESVMGVPSWSDSQEMERASEEDGSATDYFETSSSPLSTFSVDVDTASYTNFRAGLQGGSIMNNASIRLEEWINYFDYDYPQPEGDDVVGMEFELSSAPWDSEKKLLKIALQGKAIIEEEKPRANLVFLIDVSGSMLGNIDLLKGAFETLIPSLSAEDRISIVTYAGSDKIVLDPTSGSEKQILFDAISGLRSGGGTNGAAGINTAYELAAKNLFEDGVNRIILATDGDFNVGTSSTKALNELVKEKAATGIELSILGFGRASNDSMMETISNNGNGNYSFIDSANEATKVLNSELSGTLFTIAKDVKLQVEFNPTKVSSYRLIGYKNRILNHEDFADDKVDAGDMGSGHKVTAVYELVMRASDDESEVTVTLADNIPNVDELAFVNADGSVKESDSLASDIASVKIRYKEPRGDVSQLFEKRAPAVEAEEASDDMNFVSAVISLGLKVLEDAELSDYSMDSLSALATEGKGTDEKGYRAEFIEMISQVDAILTKDEASE